MEKDNNINLATILNTEYNTSAPWNNSYKINTDLKASQHFLLKKLYRKRIK